MDKQELEKHIQLLEIVHKIIQIHNFTNKLFVVLKEGFYQEHSKSFLTNIKRRKTVELQ